MADPTAQNGDDRKNRHWARDRPGETPTGAKRRADQTVANAAASGNKTAAKMKKAEDKKQEKKRRVQ